MKNIMIAGAALLMLPACNTISGVGQDMTAFGKGVSHAAGEVKDEMFPRDNPRRAQTVYRADQIGRTPYRSPPPVMPAASYRTAPSGQVYTTGPDIRYETACDMYGDELSGGNGLPPCPREEGYVQVYAAPTTRWDER